MRKITELKFDNTYASLKEEFYQRVKPTPFENPRLVSFNPDAARLLGLDPMEAGEPDFVNYFSGGKEIPGSDPVAMYYTGHQFGVYNPDIGDGRAILLGEVRNSEGRKWDIHLKGAGRTKYARIFDGRAVLRSVIREYLCSEAVHGLGILTTRALCIIGSNETVERETAETGAMMIRVSESHVRFGSFEAFFYTDRHDCVRLLADYVIEYHYNELKTERDKYVLLLEKIVKRTARLIALWQACGFTHGVMNTDNMSVLGLTIDYGPFGFLEEYDPEYVPNHSDNFGRYSFGNQPGIALWNLRMLAKALTPLIERERSEEVLETFREHYATEYVQIMRKKLGLGETMPEDGELIKKLLEVLTEEKVDYTGFFRKLGAFSGNGSGDNPELGVLFSNSSRFGDWADMYASRLRAENSADSERKERMDSVNPKYILRNYLAERAIRKAVDEHDYTEISKIHNLLKNPFSEQPEHESYSEPAPDGERNLVISCSS